MYWRGRAECGCPTVESQFCRYIQHGSQCTEERDDLLIARLVTVAIFIGTEAWCAVSAFWSLAALALVPSPRINDNLALLTFAGINAFCAFVLRVCADQLLTEE